MNLKVERPTWKINYIPPHKPRTHRLRGLRKKIMPWVMVAVFFAVLLLGGLLIGE